MFFSEKTVVFGGVELHLLFATRFFSWQMRGDMVDFEKLRFSLSEHFWASIGFGGDFHDFFLILKHFRLIFKEPMCSGQARLVAQCTRVSHKVLKPWFL